ncbi:MAG TPA: hypothetical protein VFH91_09085, partial [Pyrinomonadaceae bacterium]|nr:hypothetical protein [Pyrinomonadaceae bacterium]
MTKVEITVGSGAFRVYRSQQDQRDIHFESIQAETPEDQLQLKTEVEQSLTVIRALFPNGSSRFDEYFQSLLSLAQCGLVGEAANPEVARRALSSWKNEVTAQEGGRIKNRYMIGLGIRALLLGAPPVGVSLIIFRYFTHSSELGGFLALWGGCMAGVWLSFGARKAAFKFEDLHIPEADRLEPIVRLIFAGLLTTILGLAFSVSAVIVTIGSISTFEINTKFRVALLIGMLCGFS